VGFTRALNDIIGLGCRVFGALGHHLWACAAAKLPTKTVQWAMFIQCQAFCGLQCFTQVMEQSPLPLPPPPCVLFCDAITTETTCTVDDIMIN
jgi:hypothetical protein